MAERKFSRESIHSSNDAQLTTPRASNSTIDSFRSSSVLRRFTRTSKELNEKEIEMLLKITSFTREEIAKWHQKFLNDCPNGYMSRKQFLKMYDMLCPNGNAEKFAKHIFRAFDLDKSDTIEFREFLIGLSMTSITSSPTTKLEWIFQVFDIDGNGLLTRDECMEVIDVIVRFNQSQLTTEDNQDTEQLVASAKHSMMQVFDIISDNPTDTLTMTQFIEGCQKDDFISQLFSSNSGN